MKESVSKPTQPQCAAPFFDPKTREAGAFFQAKLTVNAPGDAFEQEADRVADAVLRMPAGTGFVQPKLRVGQAVQRQCAHCQEEEKHVQRKGGGGIPSVTPDVETTLSQTGQALDSSTRTWAESALGHDFSSVKIHTDGAAAHSAVGIGARAYTSGSNVVFGAGEFSPNTDSGRHLLVHELTHVVQQGGSAQAVQSGTIQRVPTAAELATFDADAVTVRAHNAYKKELKAASRTLIEQILKIARTRDNASYYSQKMLDLLNMPDAPAQAPVPGGAAPPPGAAPSVEETNRADTERSMYEERSRLFYTPGSSAENVEELASAESERAGRFKKRKGMEGGTFEVDAADLTNIVVRAKVFLRLKKRTKGKKQPQAEFEALQKQDKDDLAMVKELEDGIEKASAALGYTVDLQFVDKGGPGVFTADVDMNRWTDAGNFVGTAADLAHELHHLLGLDDRYNYIEAHATNDQMVMKERIYWFRQEMNRTFSASDSLMDSARTGHILPDDIAGVSGAKATDVEAAQKRTNDLIQQRRQQAMFRVQAAYLRVNSVHPSLAGAERQEALVVGRNTLKNTLSPDELDSVGTYLSRMMGALTSGEITLGPEIAPCNQWSGYVLDRRLPIHLCRRWLTSTPEEQIRTLVHESAHASGIGEPKGETYEAVFDCSARNADLQNVADAWGHFVHCLSGQTPDSAAVIKATP